MLDSAQPLLRAQTSALSDVGLVRQNNEDRYLCEPELGLFAVADGMGGHAGGEVASAMAVEGLLRAMATIPDQAFVAEPSLNNRRQLLDFLSAAISQINADIYARGNSERSLRGMGCTLDVILIRGRSLFLAHVGDSRIYGVLGGTLFPLTEDHTVGQALISSGAMTAEEVNNHPQRNQLMRALGIYPKVEIDVAYLDIAPEDSFLLCSDGVYGMIDPALIPEALRQPSELAVRTLVQAALDGGGRDNATAVVIQVSSCEAGPPIRVGSEEVRRAMEAASLFAGFTSTELLRMQQLAIGQVVEVDEPVFRESQILSEIYLVLEGRISLWSGSRRVAWMAAGDPFGELSFFPSESRTTAKADQPTRLLIFPLDSLHSLMRSDSALGVKLALNTLKRVSKRFRELEEKTLRHR